MAGTVELMGMVHSIWSIVVHNSWTDGPLEDREISMEPYWQGLPSGDKVGKDQHGGYGANSQQPLGSQFWSITESSYHLRSWTSF